MKQNELYPTFENIKNSFLKDNIGRNNDLVGFVCIIDSIENNYTISLDSAWGSGKTFFVMQVKMILDALNVNSYYKFEKDDDKEKIIEKWNTLLYNSNNVLSKSYIPVYFDAWENDTNDNPILSIIYKIALITEKEDFFKNGPSSRQIITLLSKITAAFSGIDPMDIASSLESDNIFQVLKDKEERLETIKSFLSEILIEHGDKLVVIVDELDRCNPDYAVKLLEQIKHYFISENVIFIFSVNSKELIHTIKRHYGESFDAGRYLDRFFDLSIPLPPPNYEKFYNLCDLNYGSAYIRDKIRDSCIAKYNMKMREILRFKQSYDLVTSNYLYRADSVNCTLKVIINIWVPILIAIKTQNLATFTDCISGNKSSIFSDFFNDNDYQLVQDCAVYLDLLIDDQNHRQGICAELFATQRETFAKHLVHFYHCLFNTDQQCRAGKCNITSYERNMLHKLLSGLPFNP